MPHADSSLLPPGLDTKPDFWAHILSQLTALLIPDQRSWPTNLSNAASLIYHSLRAFHAFGDGENSVNWCGFYIDPVFFPAPVLSSTSAPPSSSPSSVLLLGPFHGRPACQHVSLTPPPTNPSKPLGVCATAHTTLKPVLVPDVEEFPGHIACDGETRSEIVLPLLVRVGGGEGGGELRSVGVLDLDSIGLGAFDDVDREWLEKIARAVVDSCDW